MDSDRLHSAKNPSVGNSGEGSSGTTDWRALLAALGLVTILFSFHLVELFRFALKSDLFSHVVLIPFVSAYFIWQRRNDLNPDAKPNRGLAYAFFGLAGALVTATVSTRPLALDALAYRTMALVLLVAAIFIYRLSPNAVRKISFPLGFLIFLAPFPQAAIDAIEHFLQHTSATAASALFSLAGETYFRQDNFFQLPGIKLMVAPECSGIHSTLALLITSLVAGQFFLSSAWRRCVLALVVVPIAIVRNGFRIFVIGELCVQIGPEMIDSFIHHHGGPIFFGLSLLPFFITIYLLAKSERSASNKS
jgi:exosortase C (VPDSG-CTERM-specific)